MNFTGKKVYTVNAKTNKIDNWTCTGMFKGTYHKHKEELCVLTKDNKNCILPKRVIYRSLDKAKAVACI